MTWDASFEAYPTGDSFGSVSCLAMRQLLEEFYVRLKKEHTVTESVNPLVSHPAGVGSIVGILGGTPLTTGTLGALQYDKTGGRLYVDSSSVMSPVSGINHSLFTLNVLAESAHTQYLLFNAAATFDTLSGQLTCQYIDNLDVTEADYTGYAGGFMGLVIPKAVHKGVAGAGGNKHQNGVVNFSLAHFGQDRLKTSVAAVFSGTINQNVAVAVTLGDYSFFPYLDPASTAGNFQLMPQFIDTAASFPSGALNPVVNFYNLGATKNGVIINRRRVDPS